MPISPELALIPGIAFKFARAGLARDILSDYFHGGFTRDLADDAKRLVHEYEKETTVNFNGLENLPESGLLAFNHPNNDILLPGMLNLIVKMHELKGKDIMLVMASEIMLFAKLNEKTALPGSEQFMKRLHGLYPKNIISAPTVTSRHDFEMGRALAARRVIRKLQEGSITAISPEGHVEDGDIVSPLSTFHEGSGALARIAGKFGHPVTPVAFWAEGSRHNIVVNIGKQFIASENDNKGAVENIMKNIASIMPENLRGPFR